MRDDQQSVHCHGIISDVRELSYDPRHEVEVTRHFSEEMPTHVNIDQPPSFV